MCSKKKVQQLPLGILGVGHRWDPVLPNQEPPGGKGIQWQSAQAHSRPMRRHLVSHTGMMLSWRVWFHTWCDIWALRDQIQTETQQGQQIPKKLGKLSTFVAYAHNVSGVQVTCKTAGVLEHLKHTHNTNTVRYCQNEVTGKLYSVPHTQVKDKPSISYLLNSCPAVISWYTSIYSKNLNEVLETLKTSDSVGYGNI